MNTLAIVTSPLQIRHAVQYVQQFDLEFSQVALLIVLPGANPELAQQEADRYPWGQLVTLPPFRGVNPKSISGKASAEVKVEIWKHVEIFNRNNYLEQVNAALDKTGRTFDRILIGDYRPISFRQVLSAVNYESATCILLDDGSVSRYVMDFREGGGSSGEVTSQLLSKLGAADPFKTAEPSALSYYTIYDREIAQTDRITPNTCYSPAHLTAPRRPMDEIWLCGANHVEAGIALQSEYFLLCRQVRFWFPKEKIRYFPHRKERTGKIQIACEQIKAEIESWGGGIEEYISSTGEVPSYIVCFGSTVADTISRMVWPEVKVIVAVPRKRYFTDSKRSAHVQQIIIDNVRENPNVIGVHGYSSAPEHWFAAGGRQLLPPTACEPDIDAPLELGMFDPRIEHPKIFGMRFHDDGNETREYREKEILGLHRIDFGPVAASAENSASCFFFKIRSEGRPNLKMRLTKRNKPGEFVELKFDADVDAVVRSANENGVIAARVSVDEHRVSTVAIFFRCHGGSGGELSLLTLTSAQNESSVHRGNNAVGFSLLKHSLLAHSFTEIPLHGKATTAYFLLADTSTIALIAFRCGEQSGHLLLHDGNLDALAATELTAPQFQGDRVPLLELTAGVATMGLVSCSGLKITRADGEITFTGLKQSLNLKVSPDATLRLTVRDVFSGKQLLFGHSGDQEGETQPSCLLR